MDNKISEKAKKLSNTKFWFKIYSSICSESEHVQIEFDPFDIVFREQRLHAYTMRTNFTMFDGENIPQTGICLMDIKDSIEYLLKSTEYEIALLNSYGLVLKRKHKKTEVKL